MLPFTFCKVLLPNRKLWIFTLKKNNNKKKRKNNFATVHKELMNSISYAGYACIFRKNTMIESHVHLLCGIWASEFRSSYTHMHTAKMPFLENHSSFDYEEGDSFLSVNLSSDYFHLSCVNIATCNISPQIFGFFNFHGPFRIVVVL